MDLINPNIRRRIQDAREDPDAFWGRAGEELPWFRKWERVFDLI
jgi:acetyl-CoA synthetase